MEYNVNPNNIKSIQLRIKEYLDIFIAEKQKIENEIKHQIEFAKEINKKDLDNILKILKNNEY